MSASAAMSRGGVTATPDHIRGPASWALQAIFLLFGLLLLASTALFTVVLVVVPPPSGLTFQLVLFDVGLLTLAMAHLLAFWGLNRGREHGRTMATFVSGFYFITVFLAPLSIGLMWILWHPHLPPSGRHSIREVITALTTPHDRSGAARPNPVDGLGSRARVAICLALAAGAYAVVWFLFGGTSSGNLLTWLAAVFHVVLILVIAATIIGVGRGTEWGRTMAVFCAGALAITMVGVPLSLLIAWLLFRSRGTAAAPAALATGTA